MVSCSEIVADRSRSTDGWGGVMFGPLFAGLGVTMGIFVSAEGPWPWRVVWLVGFGGLPAVIGLVTAVRGARSLWLAHVLGTPTLTVPPSEPLQLGGLLIARFERRGGTCRAARAGRLSAVLICEEQATVGDNDHTRTHEVFRGELPAQLESGPGPVRGRIEVHVPIGMPPSLSLRYNKVVWRVQVRVEGPGVPDDECSFVVPVVSVVAAAALGGPGTEASR